eukprot:m.573249 g.573249  ORF g.573249 m.573249 type:complete len:242 (+) comp22278_c0_seq3:289-1014(+)
MPFAAVAIVWERWHVCVRVGMYVCIYVYVCVCVCFTQKDRCDRLDACMCVGCTMCSHVPMECGQTTPLCANEIHLSGCFLFHNVHLAAPGGASASNFADFNNIGKQSTGTSGGGGNFADFSALSKQPTTASQRSSGGSDTSSSSNFADFSANTKDVPPPRTGRVRTTSTNSTSSKGSRSDSTSNGDNPFSTGTTEGRMKQDGSNPFKVKTPSPAPMGENNPFANAAPPAKPEKKNSNPFKQ